MTGKTQAQKPENGRKSPFPAKKVLDGLCMVMRGLESILRAVSLYLYKNNIIDRKWMNLLIWAVNLIQVLCNSLSTDNKLEGGKR